MKVIHIAQCRATSWLQKRGVFVGQSVPVKKRLVIRAMREQEPALYAVMERLHGPEEIEEILVSMCGSLGIDLRRKKSRAIRKPVDLVPRTPALSASKVASDAFLMSYEWRRLRMQVLKEQGAKCGCCGATRADGVKMNVDHIKPRKFFPELAYSKDNLQVLCEVCNHGKGNWDTTDWRASADSCGV